MLDYHGLANFLVSFCLDTSRSELSLLSCAVFVLISVDNGPRQGLDKFLKAASDDPDTVLHYEFMQDYKALYHKLLYLVMLNHLCRDSKIAMFLQRKEFGG